MDGHPDESRTVTDDATDVPFSTRFTPDNATNFDTGPGTAATSADPK
ncbi:hypothetical protein [Microbacterium sp. 1P10AE]